MPKRSYSEAFERRFLNKVDIDDFYVKIDMYKVINKCPYSDKYEIRTTENNNFTYSGGVIMNRSKSATVFNREDSPKPS